MRIKSTKAVAAELQLALDLIETNTEDEWRDDALAVVQKLCLTRDTFICDDVWDLGLRSTHNDKALGPVMMRASRNGWCKKTGMVRPSRRSHLSGKPVWGSLLRAVAQ